jgi:dipeptidyl aminopeptidase/acylaminoacyl peptidase
VTHAERIKTPVLLVHGTLDLVAPHDHSQWMYEALVKAGHPRAKLELLRGAGHFFEVGFSGYRHDRVVELTTNWFAETLK